MTVMNHKTLPESTANAISDMIYQKNMKSGTKLPGENELAKIFEVSRNTIRKAIKILCDKNILEVIPGSGTYVSRKESLTDDLLELSLITDKKKLVSDLVEVRLLIEPHMAALAAENATVEEKKYLYYLCQEMEKCWNEKRSYYQLDMEFHTYIAGCSRNLVIHDIVPSIHRTILLQENMSVRKYGRSTVEGHWRIYKAIAEHKSLEAYQAMMTHLILNQDRNSHVI